MATCPCLRQQRSFCRQATLLSDHDKAAGGPFNTATTGFRRRNYSSLRRRKLESDAAPLRQILLQASYSTCRHDGTAVILEFKPRLENRCNQKAKTRAICASILDFKPRLANRCSQEVKTGAIRATILDFRPRLANRCSRVDHSWGQPHPPQADSAAETAQTPAGRLGSGNPQHQAQKKSPDSSLNRDSRSAAATYSPTWCSSTIGASELNFSVRDGKRWILTAITAAI